MVWQYPIGKSSTSQVLVLGSGAAYREPSEFSLSTAGHPQRDATENGGMRRSRWLKKNIEAGLVDLVRQGATFDVVVILGERLGDHRGESFLHRQSTWGLLSLVVSDQYLHISSPEYYRRRGVVGWQQMLDVPFAREQIDPSHPAFLPYRQLQTRIPQRYVTQWWMVRLDVRRRGTIEQQPFEVRWRSIWHDRHELDLIVLPESFASDFGASMGSLTTTPLVTVSRYGGYPRGLKNLTILPSSRALVQYCAARNLKRIGWMPDPFELASDTVRLFARSELGGKCELRFYHQRRDDHEDLSKLLDGC